VNRTSLRLQELEE
jgi:chromosome segregation ATPase